MAIDLRQIAESRGTPVRRFPFRNLTLICSASPKSANEPTQTRAVPCRKCLTPSPLSQQPEYVPTQLVLQEAPMLTYSTFSVHGRTCSPSSWDTVSAARVIYFESELYPASADYFSFGREFIDIAERLWAQGKWQSHPARAGSGGLIEVLAGMKEMKEGRVSGEKLVYRIDDTEWPQ
jgi:hypothetical protein